MLVNYEEEFLPKTGGLSFKKQVREVFTARAKDKVKDLQKINPNMIFLIDWDSVLTLPSDLKWKARKEELGAIDNVILYLKFSRKIGYLCSKLPAEFCKDPDCKEAFLGLKKMILHIKHNPNDDQSDGFNSHQFGVAGEELHVTLEANLPLLMRAANDGASPNPKEDETELVLISFYFSKKILFLLNNAYFYFLFLNLFVVFL